MSDNHKNAMAHVVLQHPRLSTTHIDYVTYIAIAPSEYAPLLSFGYHAGVLQNHAMHK